jgi:broad specificity phosphatase PhoE
MTEIVFVRHARTSWSGRRYCGRSDPALDAVGRRTAVALANALGPTLARDVVIVGSPARRARQTAGAIAAAAGVDRVEIDERWWEADCGLAEGRTFDELSTIEPDLAAALARGDTHIDWPGGEAGAAFAARIEAAWTSLLARDRPAVVVSHAGPLRHAIALARALPSDHVAFPEPATAVRCQVPGPARSASVLPSRA